jgi:organic radical activating enzyme
MFPIKVELVKPHTYNLVEWMLGNTCNYDCSFCHIDSKSGDKKYLDISTYIETCRKIIEESGDKKVWFKITGGEPTLYPNLIELLSYIKSTGNYTYLVTNASRTLRWWKEFKEASCIDFIAISVHPEQHADVNHIIQVINMFDDTDTTVIAGVTSPVKYFEEAVSAFNEIYKSCKTIISLWQINDGTSLSSYSTEQIEILLSCSVKRTPLYHTKPKSKIPAKYMYNDAILEYTYDDGSTKRDYSINFVKRGEDKFYGYTCDAGKNFIRISHDTIQRAVCGVGERWSIYDDKLFMTESVKCSKLTCSCTLDLIQTKRYK